jgi:hypothetical protein
MVPDQAAAKEGVMKGPIVALALALALFLGAAEAGVSTASSTATGAACARTWPRIAEGVPSSQPNTSARGLYIWHDAAGWHLRTRGAAAAGRISATGIRTSNASRVTFAQKSSSIAFSARARGQFDFSLDGCRVTFALSAPRIHLGARGTAPSKLFTLAAQAPATGIEGQTLVGPTCPVQRVDEPDCTRPVQATVHVYAAAAGGQPRAEVATTMSDAAGNWRVALSPGHYVVTGEQAAPTGKGLSRAVPVQVESGVLTRVIIEFDTGIR